eukprot:15484116-Alexandrium_andersonii.AAC.1
MAPMPASCWVRLSGPAAERSSSDWHATRGVQEHSDWARAAWAAVSKAKVRGPQACRRKAQVPPGRAPPSADSAESWRASADE